MNRHEIIAFAVAALLLAACGGKDTMASKSAAAYRDAVAKEAPASGGDAPAPPVAVDHSAHAMTPDAHASMDQTDTATHAGHGAASEHAEHAASADAHAKHGATPDAHAGMQHDSRASASMDHSQHTAPDTHAAMQHDSRASASMDHSQQDAPDAHAGHEAIAPVAGTAMDHGAHSKAAALPPHSIEVPNANSEMARVQPAATLQPDAFDAPAPSAVAEAKKDQKEH